MEPIRAAAKRALDQLLDELLELEATLPEGEQKASFNRCIHRLEEAAMAMETT
jgi:hypothetical protein